MKVLVAYGSERGGTEGIARTIGEGLREAGHEVELRPARDVRQLAGFDAAVIGGALYANRWHRDARRFVTRHVVALRRIPVWLFSSGPLDDSAANAQLPPVPQVDALAARIGARAHMTFGGRLAPDAKGFIARSMAKSHSGDWRDGPQIRAWTTELAAALPTARPGLVGPAGARSVPRLLGHAVVGATICAAFLATQVLLGAGWLSLLAHAVIAPLVFGVVAHHYFSPKGARAPLPTALVFTAAFGLFELGVRAQLLHGFEVPRSIGGFWVPLGLVLLVTWIVGGVQAMMPFPKPGATTTPAHP